MKKLILLLTLFFSSLWFNPQTAFAHILKTDGDIGAVLHVDPEDDPIAGQPTNFFLEFKDKQGKFSPQNCTCTFTILKDGKEILSQPLFQNSTTPSLESASVTFTFPEKNIYQVIVVGTPNTPDAFQKFTLTYDLRVAREMPNLSGSSSAPTPTQQSGNWFTSHIVHLILGTAVVIFLIFALMKRGKK